VVCLRRPGYAYWSPKEETLLLNRLLAPCVVFCFALASCSAESGDDDDDAGRGGEDDGGSGKGAGGSGGKGGTSAGSAGKAGSTGTGGTSTAPVPGGPHPFPQGKATGACTITSVAGASDSMRAIYDGWKASFVVQASPGFRVVRNTNNNDTVSEGIAYGMLASVYMNDRTYFDGFWAYAKSKFNSSGLMSWQLNADGSVASNGQGSASDADEDMAWALLMASAQWQSGAYLDEAKTLINRMFTYVIAADGMLTPGDSWGINTDRWYPNYFSPAYYRVFAKVTNNMAWSTVVIDKNYQMLADVTGMYGLVPDSTTRTYQHMGQYGYDACRMAWRITMDYCFNGEPRAKAYIDKIAPFFVNQGSISNIGDGYSLDGQKTSNFPNMAFIGPAGISGMAGYQSLLDNAFTYGATGTGGTTPYYQQTLRVITMLMMSGNFLDYYQHP
jgi:endo-1,4-beta-D-glucanase Y